jgi:uncharacterized protein YecE (DUF72 family)
VASQGNGDYALYFPVVEVQQTFYALPRDEVLPALVECRA